MPTPLPPLPPVTAQESRDIVKNIETLHAAASAPAALTKTAAAKI